MGTGRTIVIGDIHGCHQEWEDLLAELSVTSDDRLVSVGDLICKGPSSVRVLEMARDLPNLRCVMGNHDYYFLKEWRAGRIPNRKRYRQLTLAEMGDRLPEFMEQISAWPFTIELPEALVVHAGIRPGLPIERQSEDDLLHIREIEAGVPWYEAYREERRIVFGHWARFEPVIRSNVIGLDTSCVYGGRLSAYILPDGPLVSVPARKAYWP